MDKPQRIPGRFFKSGDDARTAQRKAIQSRRATDAWMLSDVTAYVRARVTKDIAEIILKHCPVRQLWMSLPPDAGR